MEIFDVSADPFYIGVLQEYKERRLKAREKMGKAAVPGRPREDIIREFKLLQHENINKPGAATTSEPAVLPMPYETCWTPLHWLSKIMVSDLRLGTHHWGCYLLLRTVTPADVETGSRVIVEDEKGDVIPLELHHQGTELSGAQKLAEGSVLGVKKPYVQVVGNAYHVRVDHLSDVKFLPKFDELVPVSWSDTSTKYKEPTDWKLAGKGAFDRGDYRSAIDCYSKALTLSPSNDLANTIQLDRAMAFLKTHQFDAALDDIEATLRGPEQSETALFRKALTLYHLGRFKESCDIHDLLGKKYPGSPLARHERASARLAEQESGRYDFKEMQLEASKRRPPHLDNASYIGPVALKETGKLKKTRRLRMRLFTTEAVKAGDLLLCEKAFAHAFPGSDISSGVNLLLNPEPEQATIGTQGKLLDMTTQKLYKNPSLSSTFADLYGHKFNPVACQDVDGRSIVNTFHAQRIIQLHSFGCPLSSRESHVAAVSSLTAARQFHKKFFICGIWSLASYIKHSCLSNARRSFIGDMMIVRATQDIAADTEVTISFQTPLAANLEETAVSLKYRGYKYTPGLLASTRTGEVGFQRIEEIISKIADTYDRPASKIPRLALWAPYLALARAYLHKGKFENAIESALKYLEALGYVIDGFDVPTTSNTSLIVQKWGMMTDSNVGCWLILSSAYHEVAPSLESQAIEYAKISYRICVGEDETFFETYYETEGE
ncbi:hypothetical protein N7532_002409 [Penicillium argentinense]|uniref:SET domain-containing protein n=1 Tax=Penicillium argentinense TaxID=1131581 RepID=A0A9W9G0A4_9EURO|nr:uncharacterized protein N7532_002409 [Penicillium argentinense]KAJ5109764.1 hypothetical protein N7532_002409 [Penicillium argentinense]